MKVILSPAKSLDFKPIDRKLNSSSILFPDHSFYLLSLMKEYQMTDLVKLMKISPKLAELNYERFQMYELPVTPVKQAILAFTGDVYKGLDAQTLTVRDLDYAQNCVRIISGLYGILRPLDLIKPYRLEMGLHVANQNGPDLYSFWRQRLTNQLTKELKADDSVLINLASEEYSSAIHLNKIAEKNRVIKIVFKEYKDKQYKVVGILAKRARGLMTRYILQNRIVDPEELKKFDVEGYLFYPDVSTLNEWVFIR